MNLPSHFTLFSVNPPAPIPNESYETLQSSPQRETHTDTL